MFLIYFGFFDSCIKLYQNLKLLIPTASPLMLLSLLKIYTFLLLSVYCLYGITVCGVEAKGCLVLLNIEVHVTILLSPLDWFCTFKIIVLSNVYFQDNCPPNFCTFRIIALPNSVLSRLLPFQILYFQDYCSSKFCTFKIIALPNSVLSRLLPFLILHYQDYCPS